MPRPALSIVPDPDDLAALARRRMLAQRFDQSSEHLMISVQTWIAHPTPAAKNIALAALTSQLQAWKALNDAMPLD